MLSRGAEISAAINEKKICLNGLLGYIFLASSIDIFHQTTLSQSSLQRAEDVKRGNND